MLKGTLSPKDGFTDVETLRSSLRKAGYSDVTQEAETLHVKVSSPGDLLTQPNVFLIERVSFRQGAEGVDYQFGVRWWLQGLLHLLVSGIALTQLKTDNSSIRVQAFVGMNVAVLVMSFVWVQHYKSKFLSKILKTKSA